MKPLAIDLYCGLGGWAEGFLSEGYRVVGFDIERHDYGTGGYPGELVLRDVRSIHGAELVREYGIPAVIVGSSPCQEFSYRAMPWKRAKALPPPYLGIELFEAQFRIQREASEAVGRYIPLIVENVRGAQKWVGKSKANFGSYHLWGDVGMVGNRIVAGPLSYGTFVSPVKAIKVPGFRFDGSGKSFQSASVEASGYKTSGLNWSDRSIRGQDFTRVAGRQIEGRKQSMGGSWYGDYEKFKSRVGEHIKQGGDWFGRECQISMSRLYSSRDPRRKAASAQIAKIPFPLAQHIARCFKPNDPDPSCLILDKSKEAAK